MNELTKLPLLVDTDCALGSAAGDIDDGIALATLFGSGAPVELVLASYGNTSATDARQNSEAIARLCARSPRFAFGAHAPEARVPTSSLLPAGAFRWLCLGPLTTVAHWLAHTPEAKRANCREVIAVTTCMGFAAPVNRFFDFNAACDPVAARSVLQSNHPLLLVPLDVARTLRFRPEDLAGVRGPLGRYLRGHSARWFRRSRRIKARRDVPIWDVAAAIAAIRPDLVRFDVTTLHVGKDGKARYGVGERVVRRVVSIDAPRALAFAAEAMENASARWLASGQPEIGAATPLST